MSIVICVMVGEGLVLGADSSTTLSAQDGSVLNIFDYTRKLAHLKNYPIGILNWGLNSLGPRNIQSLIAEFEHTLPLREDTSSYQLREISELLLNFFTDRYNGLYENLPPEERPLLGTCVAGFSHGTFFPEIYAFQFPHDQNIVRLREDRADGTPDFGALWFGQTDAIARMYKGLDPRTEGFLKSKGIPDNEIQDHAGQLEYPVSFDGMPLQDAIDFVYWLISLVIGRFRFVIGPPTCGGEIDIAVVTHSDFTWVYRKSWQPRQQ